MPSKKSPPNPKSPPPTAIKREKLSRRSSDYNWEQDYPQGWCLPEDIAEMLEQLSPRQRTYVYARTHGKSRTSTCELLGVSSEMGNKWETAPWWTPAETKERAIMFGDANALIGGMMPTVLSRMERELALGDDSKVGHDTMLWIAEKLLGKPSQKVAVEHEGADPTQDVVDILKAVAGVASALPRAEQRRLESAPRVEVIEVTPVAAPGDLGPGVEERGA